MWVNGTSLDEVSWFACTSWANGPLSVLYDYESQTDLHAGPVHFPISIPSGQRAGDYSMITHCEFKSMNLGREGKELP